MRQINKICTEIDKLSKSEGERLAEIDKSHSNDHLQHKSVWLIVDNFGTYLGVVVLWHNNMVSVAQCSKRKTLTSTGLDTGDHSDMENPLTLFRRKFAETNRNVVATGFVLIGCSSLT